MLIVPTSQIRKLRHRESSKSRGLEVGQMKANVAEQNRADIGEGGERGTAGWVGQVILAL